jgi:hypothetical protein
MADRIDQRAAIAGALGEFENESLDAAAEDAAERIGEITAERGFIRALGGGRLAGDAADQESLAGGTVPAIGLNDEAAAAPVSLHGTGGEMQCPAESFAEIGCHFFSLAELIPGSMTFARGGTWRSRSGTVIPRGMWMRSWSENRQIALDGLRGLGRLARNRGARGGPQ